MGRDITMIDDTSMLRQQARIRKEIEIAIASMFSPEDKGLQDALNAVKEAGLPQIQISAIEGKLLYLLAKMCNARLILEIGSLAGYSGIWLARALPRDGHLITIEIDPGHAEITRKCFSGAGVGNCAEVRVGDAIDLLPQLVGFGPFDLVFIDADKISYPQYLNWSLRLTRPGSIIVADNCIRSGRVFREPENQDIAALAEYNRKVVNNPGLVSLALALDKDYTDGFTIALVLPKDEGERVN
jgi:caffeoyl-CoA O-methyltransferase